MGSAVPQDRISVFGCIEPKSYEDLQFAAYAPETGAVHAEINISSTNASESHADVRLKISALDFRCSQANRGNSTCRSAESSVLGAFISHEVFRVSTVTRDEGRVDSV